jgi:alpha-N-arabinofuranosidase
MLTRRTFLSALSSLCALGRTESFALRAPSAGERVHAALEYHVSPQGSDSNDGSRSRPLRTISAAAALAQAGDTITVHRGIYRERIRPPRGGTSDTQRITYQAASGEEAVITGAEEIAGWKQVAGDVWKVTIPNSFFGSFNPYGDLIHGDWFNPKGRNHHTGAVYRHGDWLIEAAARDEVFQPAGATALWFGEADADSTTLWAQFPQADPNDGHTEINVRQTVFYPEKPGINYLTVRGFALRQAATPWAPPTAEQIGLIGTHWSKGWIIENNAVSYSICSGIALGKYGDQWDNTSQNSAEGYVKTIERAEQNGWSKENIGHHIVRGNTVSHCEQAGIVGSLGAVFCLVTHNTVHDIHVRQLFTGAEMAGIKFHAAIDTQISHNTIYHTCLGLWLDWMAQGTRVSGNLFHDNIDVDLMVEVDHGPFLVDNNVFLSPVSQRVVSQGGAYAHNLFCGGVRLVPFDGRMTPFMEPHSTEVAGYHNNPSGDLRFYNNLFAQAGDLSPFDQTRLPVFLGGNVFLKGSKACAQEASPLLLPEFDPSPAVTGPEGDAHLEITLDRSWAGTQASGTEVSGTQVSGTEARRLVTTAMLGNAAIPNLPFVQPDNAPLLIDSDYRGRARSRSNPFPGPFEAPAGGRLRIEIQPGPI